jgi:hypothetical protein
MYDEDDVPLWDPDQLPRVIGLGEAKARGLSAYALNRRARRGAWRHILPRVYRTGTDVSRWDRLEAALIFAGLEARLTGAAALWVEQFRILFPDLVSVVVPRERGVRSCAWVRVIHSARTPEPRLDSGPRRVEVARAVADHALTLGRIDDVREVVAWSVREQWCSIAELKGELDAGPRNGSALFRQALQEVDAGAASAPEAEAARILRAAGVAPFEQNSVIRLPNGSSYVADLLWRALRAILEIDSVEYHLNPADWRRTMDRHLALSTLGYSVVHRPPSALRDPARFAAEIGAWLANLRAARSA